ncbi:hypothetical protein [Cetobacterium sp.]|uniref:hypothetical protein n=1 Tax=Cetobacterium sp. TaxID=2071632 RepID=UPI003F3253D7
MSQKLKLLLFLLILNLIYFYKFSNFNYFKILALNTSIVTTCIFFNKRNVKRNRYKYYFK